MDGRDVARCRDCCKFDKEHASAREVFSFDYRRIRLVPDGMQPCIIKIAVTVGIMAKTGEPLLVNDRHCAPSAADKAVVNQGVPHAARMNWRYSSDVRDLLSR